MIHRSRSRALSNKSKHTHTQFSFCWFITNCTKQQALLNWWYSAPSYRWEGETELEEREDQQIHLSSDLSNVLCSNSPSYSSLSLSLTLHRYRHPYTTYWYSCIGLAPAQINGKSLLVERKIIYIHEYEICHRKAYWHIASVSVFISLARSLTYKRTYIYLCISKHSNCQTITGKTVING